MRSSWLARAFSAQGVVFAVLGCVGCGIALASGMGAESFVLLGAGLVWAVRAH